jgi:hypothetical protein
MIAKRTGRCASAAFTKTARCCTAMTGAPTATTPSSCPGPPYRSAYSGLVTGPNTCASSAGGPSRRYPVQIHSFQSLGQKAFAVATHGTLLLSSDCSALSDLPMRLNIHAVLCCVMLVPCLHD